MHSSSVRRGVTSDPSPPNLRGTASNPLPRIWKLRHTGYDVTQMCFTSSRCSLRRTREARVWGIQGFKVSRIPSWAVVGIAWRCLWCAGCTLGPAIWGRAYGLVPHFLLGFKFLLLIIVFDKFSRVWEGSSGGLSGRFRPFFWWWCHWPWFLSWLFAYDSAVWYDGLSRVWLLYIFLNLVERQFRQSIKSHLVSSQGFAAHFSMSWLGSSIHCSVPRWTASIMSCRHGTWTILAKPPDMEALGTEITGYLIGHPLAIHKGFWKNFGFLEIHGLWRCEDLEMATA